MVIIQWIHTLLIEVLSKVKVRMITPYIINIMLENIPSLMKYYTQFYGLIYILYGCG